MITDEQRSQCAYRPKLVRLAEECGHHDWSVRYAERMRDDRYASQLHMENPRDRESVRSLIGSLDDKARVWWSLHCKRTMKRDTLRENEFAESRRMGWFIARRLGMIVDPELGRVDKPPPFLADYEREVLATMPAETDRIKGPCLGCYEVGEALREAWNGSYVWPVSVRLAEARIEAEDAARKAGRL